MDNPLPLPPRFKTNEFGAVDFEGYIIPCAFGGEPGKLTAYILLEGVCQIIGMPLESEIFRIQTNHLLADGLFIIAFPVLNEAGKTVRMDQPAISLTRLHTWLALIPPELVLSDEMHRKLINTQQHFSDVVYAYFGRRLMPREMREEDDPYIDPELKQLYDRLEEASRLDSRLTAVEDEIGQIRILVNDLSEAISGGNSQENISADQQEQLKAMIDILSARYEKKHGKGTRGALINDIKGQHNFRFYNTVPKAAWVGVVRDCVYRFRQLNPRGTALPRVFQIALDSTDQNSLF